jgi:hypothetical protein
MSDTTAPRIVRSENDIRRFDGHVGAGTDRNTDVGSSQRGCVVHSIANHRDRHTASLQLRDFGIFVFGQDLCHDFVDAELASDAFGDLLCVSRDEHDAAAHPVQCCNGFSGFWPDLVFERQCADDAMIVHEEENRALRFFH